MPTIQQQINQLKKDKENLNTMLNTMGVETTGNETFTQLTPLVGKIVTDPILQDKSITIKENGTQTIKADEGYDGLNNVEVTTDIASSGGGEVPEQGFVVNEWDSQGYPLEITVVGKTTVPTYFFTGYMATGATTAYGMFTRTTKFNLPSNLKTIGENAFRCSGVKDIDIPPSVETINGSCFYYCKNLTQISFPNLVTIKASNSATAPFYSSGLKAIWLGSAITTMSSYSFSNCSTLTKIFIDLPRVTVEAMKGYSSAWGRGSANVGIIVCNDDEGFITKEEFDATTW